MLVCDKCGKKGVKTKESLNLIDRVEISLIVIAADRSPNTVGVVRADVCVECRSDLNSMLLAGVCVVVEDGLAWVRERRVSA